MHYHRLLDSGLPYDLLSMPVLSLEEERIDMKKAHLADMSFLGKEFEAQYLEMKSIQQAGTNSLCMEPGVDSDHPPKIFHI